MAVCGGGGCGITTGDCESSCSVSGDGESCSGGHGTTARGDGISCGISGDGERCCGDYGTTAGDGKSCSSGGCDGESRCSDSGASESSYNDGDGITECGVGNNGTAGGSGGHGCDIGDHREICGDGDIYDSGH